MTEKSNAYADEYDTSGLFFALLKQELENGTFCCESVEILENRVWKAFSDELNIDKKRMAILSCRAK